MNLDPDTTSPMPITAPPPRTPDPTHAPHTHSGSSTATGGGGGGGGGSEAEGRFTPNPWRRRVADRLTLAGRRHTRHTFDLAGTTRRPGPHALIFLHRDSDPHCADPASGTVKIATRMFLHGEDVTDLHTILTALHDRALEYHRAGIAHPIAHLTDTAEPMTRSARYLGLATSTIDPTRAAPPEGWPWQGLAQLTDGTRLVLRGISTVASPDLQVTHTLNPADTSAGVLDAFDPARAWSWIRPDLDLSDPDLAAHLDALHTLHTFIQTTEATPRRHRRRPLHTGPAADA